LNADAIGPAVFGPALRALKNTQVIEVNDRVVRSILRKVAFIFEIGLNNPAFLPLRTIRMEEKPRPTL
jgi:hypothetical protein